MFERMEGKTNKYGRFEWTDIRGASRQLVTPNFPGTKLFGTCDVSSGSAAVGDFKTAAGDALRLRDRFLNELMRITVRDSGGLYHTRTVVSIGSSTLTADAAFSFDGSDVDFWVYPADDRHQYVVTAVQLLSDTEATYTFRDESHIRFGNGQDSQGEIGVPGAVGNLVNLGANGGLATKIPFPVTPGDRLYVESDAAAAGSLVIWYKEVAARYLNVASDPVTTTSTTTGP